MVSGRPVSAPIGTNITSKTISTSSKRTSGATPLLDAAQGRIARLVLAISSFGVEAFADSCQSVLTHLPRDVRIDILVSPRAKARVAEWVEAAGRTTDTHLVQAPEDLDFSLWMQDVFAVTAGTPHLLLPATFSRYDDLAAVKHLAKELALPVTEKDLAFEGGNMLVCGDLLLIGANRLGPAPLPSKDLAKQLDGDRRAVVLGCSDPLPSQQKAPFDLDGEQWTSIQHHLEREGRVQPLFHIDLFIAPAGTTPGGRPRFLVGCPRLGAKLLDHPILDHALAPAFDEIAGQLKAAGAEVIRNPLPLIWMDEPEKRHRTWFHLPANNVLVEDCGRGRSRVFLPCFAQDHWQELERIDAANAAIWEDLGFEVISIPDLLPLAENRGALHCMCKVIARNPAPTA
jgi:hypothetical protein